MTTSDRGQKIYDIDPNSFSKSSIKGYMVAYFKDGSLNITTGVPILVLESSSNWMDICIDSDHPFYNVFKELSRDSKDLYNYYFKGDKIILRVNGKNIKEVKQYCKLNTKVRILFKEGIVFKGENDPQYFSEWRFLLDLNRFEFI